MSLKLDTPSPPTHLRKNGHRIRVRGTSTVFSSWSQMNQQPSNQFPKPTHRNIRVYIALPSSRQNFRIFQSRIILPEKLDGHQLGLGCLHDTIVLLIHSPVRVKMHYLPNQSGINSRQGLTLFLHFADY